jgi:hypothetical protein
MIHQSATINHPFYYYFTFEVYNIFSLHTSDIDKTGMSVHQPYGVTFKINIYARGVLNHNPNREKGGRLLSG